MLDVMLEGRDSLTTLAVEAARKALQMAKVDTDDVDLVLMCTSTPEDLFGSAPQVSVISYYFTGFLSRIVFAFMLDSVIGLTLMLNVTLTHFK